MKRTDLVNYLLGFGMATLASTTGNWGLTFGVWQWWEMTIAKLIVLIGAAVVGWYSQIGVNLAQGEGHQLGVADDAEQNRARYGGVAASVLFSIVFLFSIKNFVPFWITGGALVAVAVGLWGYGWVKEKLRK